MTCQGKLGNLQSVSIRETQTQKNSRGKTVYIYVIHCTADGTCWRIHKRYSEFERLHEKLTEKYNELPELPSKRGIMGRLRPGLGTDRSYYETRRRLLEDYLNKLLLHEAKTSGALRSFLSSEQWSASLIVPKPQPKVDDNESDADSDSEGVGSLATQSQFRMMALCPLCEDLSNVDEGGEDHVAARPLPATAYVGNGVFVELQCPQHGRIKYPVETPHGRNSGSEDPLVVDGSHSMSSSGNRGGRFARFLGRMLDRPRASFKVASPVHVRNLCVTGWPGGIHAGHVSMSYSVFFGADAVVNGTPTAIFPHSTHRPSGVAGRSSGSCGGDIQLAGPKDSVHFDEVNSSTALLAFELWVSFSASGRLVCLGSAMVDLQNPQMFKAVANGCWLPLRLRRSQEVYAVASPAESIPQVYIQLEVSVDDRTAEAPVWTKKSTTAGTDAPASSPTTSTPSHPGPQPISPQTSHSSTRFPSRSLSSPAAADADGAPGRVDQAAPADKWCAGCPLLALGQIRGEILEAKGLPLVSGRSGLGNMFGKVKMIPYRPSFGEGQYGLIRDQKFRTPTVLASVDPRWNAASFRFIVYPWSEAIDIAVYEEGMLGQRKAEQLAPLLGHAVFPLSMLAPSCRWWNVTAAAEGGVTTSVLVGELECWVPLQWRDGETLPGSGIRVRLSVQLHTVPAVFPRLASYSSGQKVPFPLGGVQESDGGGGEDMGAIWRELVFLTDNQDAGVDDDFQSAQPSACVTLPEAVADRSREYIFEVRLERLHFKLNRSNSHQHWPTSAQTSGPGVGGVGHLVNPAIPTVVSGLNSPNPAPSPSESSEWVAVVIWDEMACVVSGRACEADGQFTLGVDWEGFSPTMVYRVPKSAMALDVRYVRIELYEIKRKREDSFDASEERNDSSGSLPLPSSGLSIPGGLMSGPPRGLVADIGCSNCVGSVKVDLLTIATGPAHHDLPVMSGFKQLGRLRFNIHMDQLFTCGILLRNVHINLVPPSSGASTVTGRAQSQLEPAGGGAAPSAAENETTEPLSPSRKRGVDVDAGVAGEVLHPGTEEEEFATYYVGYRYTGSMDSDDGVTLPFQLHVLADGSLAGPIQTSASNAQWIPPPGSTSPPCSTTAEIPTSHIGQSATTSSTEDTAGGSSGGGGGGGGGGSGSGSGSGGWFPNDPDAKNGGTLAILAQEVTLDEVLSEGIKIKLFRKLLHKPLAIPEAGSRRMSVPMDGWEGIGYCYLPFAKLFGADLEEREGTFRETLYKAGKAHGATLGRFAVSGSPTFKQTRSGCHTEDGFILRHQMVQDVEVRETAMRGFRSKSENLPPQLRVLMSHCKSLEDGVPSSVTEDNIPNILRALSYTFEHDRLVYTYRTPQELLSARQTLIVLWSWLIGGVDLMPYRSRGMWFDCIILILRRAEMQVGLSDLLDVPVVEKDASGEKTLTPHALFIVEYANLLRKTLRYVLVKLARGGMFDTLGQFCANYLAIVFFRMSKVRRIIVSAVESAADQLTPRTSEEEEKEKADPAAGVGVDEGRSRSRTSLRGQTGRKSSQDGRFRRLSGPVARLRFADIERRVQRLSLSGRGLWDDSKALKSSDASEAKQDHPASGCSSSGDEDGEDLSGRFDTTKRQADRFHDENPQLFGWDAFYQRLQVIAAESEQFLGVETDPETDKLLCSENWLIHFRTPGDTLFMFIARLFEHVAESVLEKDTRSNFVYSPGIPGLTSLLRVTVGYLNSLVVREVPPVVVDAVCSMIHIGCTEVLNAAAFVVLAHTNLFSVDDVIACLDLLDVFFQANPRSQLPSSFDYDVFLHAIGLLLDSVHFRTLSHTLRFLYNHMQQLPPRPWRSLVADYLLNEFFYTLFLHWNADVRFIFYHVIAYRIVPPSDGGFSTNVPADKRNHRISSDAHPLEGGASGATPPPAATCDPSPPLKKGLRTDTSATPMLTTDSTLGDGAGAVGSADAGAQGSPKASMSDAGARSADIGTKEELPPKRPVDHPNVPALAVGLRRALACGMCEDVADLFGEKIRAMRRQFHDWGGQDGPLPSSSRQPSTGPHTYKEDHHVYVASALAEYDEIIQRRTRAWTDNPSTLGAPDISAVVAQNSFLG